VSAPVTLAHVEQSLWLDGLTRDMVVSGALDQYIMQGVVTGAIVSPGCLHAAIGTSTTYDAVIRDAFDRRLSREEALVELVLDDAVRAADLFRPMFDRTHGVHGWVSLESTALLTGNADRMLAIVQDLHVRARRPNVLFGIPGIQEGLSVAEGAIVAGIPVNVGLLFSAEQYIAAADAFLRGIERRIAGGLPPNVAGAASIVLHHWDGLRTRDSGAASMNQLPHAIAERIYRMHRLLLNSPRWQRAQEAGVRPQRLLWMYGADEASVTLFTAPAAVHAVPEHRLKAVVDLGMNDITRADDGNCEAVLGSAMRSGIDIPLHAARLQADGLHGLVMSWENLLAVMARKGAACAAM
jgi:transaldolase